MKKVFLTMFLVLVVAFALYGSDDAISGVCSGSYTMQDSQDGDTVATSGPKDQLLRGSCLECHSGSTVSVPMVETAIVIDTAAEDIINTSFTLTPTVATTLSNANFTDYTYSGGVQVMCLSCQKKLSYYVQREKIN
jgi:hypothetical protein